MKVIFGVVFVLILILAVATGAFFLGKKSTPQTQAPFTQTQATEEFKSETFQPMEQTQPKVTKKSVTAGGVLSFFKYKVSLSPQWKETIERDEKTEIDRLTLKRDGYEIRIFQGATGGAICLYSSDPDVEGPSARYTNFIEINTSNGNLLRRSGALEPTGFTVCEKRTEGFIQPTNFGHINYVLPPNFDQKILLEMDEIIVSLTKE